MVGFPVVCPVCGAREELDATTVSDVCTLMNCGWAREEDHESPVWEHFEPVFEARLEGEEVKQGLVDELFRGL